MTKPKATLRSVLEEMRSKAQVKAYRDPPRGARVHSGFLLTYCLEQVPGGVQPTLAVSKRDGETFTLDNEFVGAIYDVFGMPEAVGPKSFPGRGHTSLFIWGVRDGSN